ncbi:MAG: hypothetical protein K0S56_1737, partial [Microvirga sp.]|nr:hypothetical protein [Microvirga sp.]
MSGEAFARLRASITQREATLALASRELKELGEQIGQLAYGASTDDVRFSRRVETVPMTEMRREPDIIHTRAPAI